MYFSKLVLFLQYLVINLKHQSTYVEALIGKNVRNALEKEFPYVVSIGLDQRRRYADEKHFCTGALISRWHVLTAAHCFEKLPRIQQLQVTIGSVDLRKGRAFFSREWKTYVDWVASKTDIKPFGDHDIAVMKLTEKMNEPTIKPADLWNGIKYKTLNWKITELAGWGYSSNKPPLVPQFLQTTWVQVLSNSRCNEYRRQLNSFSLIPERYICTNAHPHAFIESGDSGGPLIYRNTIIGVNTGTSPKLYNLSQHFSENVIHNNRVNVHASIIFYRTFINECLKYF